MSNKYSILDMSLSKLWEIVKGQGSMAWCSHGVSESWI